jgi:serine/threonine-protein kinase RsbT
VVDEIVVAVTSEKDVVSVRQEGRSMALALGLSRTEAALIATAISEVARNIVQHASRGEVRLSPKRQGETHGIEVIAVDSGPGISDVDAALEGVTDKGEGLGLGLPGARRLMDEFEIGSDLGDGTTVRMVKWKIAP